MSVMSEMSVLSENGDTRTTIRYSSRDQYVEISQSKISKTGPRKQTNTIQLTPNLMSAVDAFLFCGSIDQAFEVVFGTPLGGVTDDDDDDDDYDE